MTPDQFKNLRLRIGSQQRLADIFGYSRRQIVRMEMGQSPISVPVEIALKFFSHGKPPIEPKN